MKRRPMGLEGAGRTCSLKLHIIYMFSLTGWRPIINISHTAFNSMRLSAFSDYSLRVLMLLGTNTDRLVTVGEIARTHAISEHHLTKIVHQLGRAGFIETLRGKGGGMRLARAPHQITIGEVLRHTETDFSLVECFTTHSSCQIEPSCQLRPILDEALAAMLRVLDAYTLADTLRQAPDIHALVRITPPAGKPAREQ